MPKTDNGFKSRDDPPEIILQCLNCKKEKCNNCVSVEVRKNGGIKKAWKNLRTRN